MKQTHAQLRSAKNAQLGAKTGFEQVSLFCRRYPEEGFRRLSNRTNSSLAAGRGDGAEAHDPLIFDLTDSSSRQLTKARDRGRLDNICPDAIHGRFNVTFMHNDEEGAEIIFRRIR